MSIRGNNLQFLLRQSDENDGFCDVIKTFADLVLNIDQITFNQNSIFIVAY